MLDQPVAGLDQLMPGRGPDVSPKGRYITFVSTADLDVDLRSTTSNGDGSEEVFLLNSKAEKEFGSKHLDPELTPTGVRKAVLRAGAAGKARILVESKGGSPPDPGLELMEPVAVELINSNTATTGVCSGDTYTGALVVENSAIRFKAKK